MLVIMNIIDVRRLKSALIIVVTILTGLVAWQVFRTPHIALLIFCCIAIMSPFHAVRLYWRNDSMIGGLPRANYTYTVGFVILASGNLLTCWSFLSNNEGLVYLGSLLLIAGIGFLVGASSLLFKHIIRRGLRSQQ